MVTYNDFRKVLKRCDFTLVRSKKHETWQKILPDGSILQVRLSHQHGKDIPKALFHKMLKQAYLTEEDFRKLLV
ncbi:MAG TPA: type II toxin-antitoxin system HicA family toxin [Thermodesulfobacteriota bacterium]|nr:type II toxin-antitoxin system HicA family toxin [Thermodesulfobacteriota bacterium]